MTSARPQPWAEAHAPDGTPRPHYATVLAELAATDPAELAERLAAGVADAGLDHGPADRRRALTVDAVPRILTQAEWRGLEAGLAQRVRALDAFVADAQGAREAWKEGIVPADVLAGSVHDDARPREPAPVRIAVAGIDLARDPSGTFRVLEDNVRTPSGLAVLLGVASVLRRELAAAAGLAPRGFGDVGERLSCAAPLAPRTTPSPSRSSSTTAVRATSSLTSSASRPSPASPPSSSRTSRASETGSSCATAAGRST